MDGDGITAGVRRQYLSSVPAIHGLSRGEVDAIMADVDVRDYAPGDVIARQGEAGAGLYIVASGRADCTHVGVDGAVKTYQAGEFFGERALLLDGPEAPRDATVTAATSVTVLVLAKAAYQVRGSA
jgi:cAMP-dependent protein kinase regulator